MRIKNYLPLILFVFSACSSVTGLVSEDAFEMGEASIQASNQLFVEPKAVAKERRDFIEKLTRTDKDQRRLYEDYLNVIGANGILDGIEKAWPKCHSEAHDAGKVIFAQVHDIGNSLRICANRCYSGCMHGVLMEAFAGATQGSPQSAFQIPLGWPTLRSPPERHVNLPVIERVMNDVCYENTIMVSSYSPGDCAHGVGHALMFVTGYNIPEAIQACGGFQDRAMAYYCATGAYMEYVTEHDAEDAKSKSLHYPCDIYDYPAACSRYKMVHVAHRHYQANKKMEDLIRECEKLTGKFRLGCFHGFGNAHMWMIASGKVAINKVCAHGTDSERFMCIEGAMERMAKFHEKRALTVCEELEGEDRNTCFAAAKHKMYPMKKDFALYLSE